MAYPEKNQLVLIKKHSTTADPVPGLTDAVYCEQPDSTPDFGNVTTNEVGGGLDDPIGLPGASTLPFNTAINLKGSGTAGTEPDFAPAMEASAMPFTNFAADVTGTAQAGAAQTITLASGASAVNDFYKGQIIELTGGTGSGQKPRLIVGYVGSTKVATVYPSWTAADMGAEVAPSATSVYAIRKGTRFGLASTSLAKAAIYHYAHRDDGGNSRLQAILNACANAQIAIKTGQPTKITFNFRGGLLEDQDVSHPGDPTYDNKIAPVFIRSKCFAGNSRLQLNELNIDLGNRVTVEDDPNEDFGKGLAGITGRSVGGTMLVPMALKAVRDVFNSWLNSTEQLPITILYGSVAGNRIAILVEKQIFSGVSRQVVEGNIYNSLPFRTNGINTGVYIYLW